MVCLRLGSRLVLCVVAVCFIACVCEAKGGRSNLQGFNTGSGITDRTKFIIGVAFAVIGAITSIVVGIVLCRMFCWCKNCKGPSKPKSRGKDTFVNCGMNATKATAIATIDNDFPTSKLTTPTDYKASYDNDIHEPPSNEHAVNVSKGSYPDVGNKDGLPYLPKASKPTPRGKDTFVNCNVNHARNDVKPTPIATIDNAFPTSKRATPTDYNDGLPNWPKASKPKSRGKDTFVNCNVNHARNAVKPTPIATIDNAFPTICATPTDYNDGLDSSRWRLTLQIRPTGFPAQ